MDCGWDNDMMVVWLSQSDEECEEHTFDVDLGAFDVGHEEVLWVVDKEDVDVFGIESLQ